MSYHNTSSTVQRTTNAQGQTAPAGYHYMPDGSLMSDAEHARLYSAKIINSFNLDLNDIKATGETRTFTIRGNSQAEFSLEVTNEDGKYYNFQTNLFQTAQTRLSKISINGGQYTGFINFPLVTDADQYDFYLFAEEGTYHSEYKQVRFADGSIDINSSTGSNSNLVQKTIYQTLDTTIYLSSYSIDGSITGTNTTVPEITGTRNKNVSNVPFTHVFTVSSTRTLTIDRQPTSDDVMAFVTRTIGAAQIDIPGENIYPAVTHADKVVNGEVTDAANVTMDDDVGDAPDNLWAVGDRITGNTVLDARTNADAVTVTAVSVGGNDKIFTMSEAIAIDDDETLSFSRRRNFMWPIDNIDLLAKGMRIINATTNGFTNEAYIKEYVDEITIFEGEVNEKVLINKKVTELDTLGVKPTLTRNATTNVKTTVQTGNISFSEQALLTMAGSTQKIFSYGVEEISRLTGYDIEFSDLKAELTAVETTTTASTIGAPSTSVVIANRAGIMDGISTVRGIGIDSTVANPTVSSGAGSVTGAGTIVLSAAQELESGATLSFDGAGVIITLTGNIRINKVGNEDVTLRFDINKFLSMH